MIRLALVLGFVAGPLAAQSVIEERPGRWFAVPGGAGGAEAQVLTPSGGNEVIELVAPPPGPILNGASEAVAGTAQRPLPRPGEVSQPEAPLSVVPMITAVALSGLPVLPLPERPPRVVVIERPDGWAEIAADSAPVAARPRVAAVRGPNVPNVQEGVAAMDVARTAPVSAVLLPLAVVSRPEPVARVVLAAAPAPERFPASALPPGALPQAPESLARATQSPLPQTEPMAAVLLAAVRHLPEPDIRALPPVALALPERGRAPIDPEAPVRLPDPHPQAVARMMGDVAICWRLADLDAEARWAQITVDVALDDTNMPSGASIRLTGFRGVVSGAAEEAYRAARAALTGCAEASAQAPATEAVSLVFDRNGIHLQ